VQKVQSKNKIRDKREMAEAKKKNVVRLR